MYVDSSDLYSPVAMETDVPLIEDVQRLKNTVEEGATQVNLATLCHLSYNHTFIILNNTLKFLSEILIFNYFSFLFHIFMRLDKWQQNKSVHGHWNQTFCVCLFPLACGLIV